MYVEAPQGQLGRPRRELAGFAKTPLLAPGESAEVTVEFPVNAMAAYDDLGVTGNRSCYVLEAGTYRIWAGTSVRQLAAVPVDGQEGFAVEQLTVDGAADGGIGPGGKFSPDETGSGKSGRHPPDSVGEGAGKNIFPG